jgi:hypothetical protein
LTAHLFFAKKTPRLRSVRTVWHGVVVGALMSGCALTELPMPPPNPVVVMSAVPPAPTVLSEAAQTALTAAESSVAHARAKRALWTAAVRELANAHAAAKVFDSDKTIQHAQEAVILCKLSIEQLSAPPVTW